MTPPPGQEWIGVWFLPWSVLSPIGEEEAPAPAPGLVTSHRNHHDDNRYHENAIDAPPAIAYVQQITQPALGIRPNLGQDNPGPANPIDSPHVIPNIRQGHRKQDVTHQLPLRSPLGYRDVQISHRHIRYALHHQRQQGDETDDEQKPDLLHFRGPKPG